MLQNSINRTTSALETADPNGRERIDGVICTTFQAIVVMVHTTTITDADVLKRSGAVLYHMREGRGAKIDEGDPQGTYAKMLKEIDDASKMRSQSSEKQKQQELAARKQRAEEEARRQEEERRRQEEEARRQEEKRQREKEERDERQIRELDGQKEKALAYVRNEIAANENREVRMLGVRGAGSPEVNGWYYEVEQNRTPPLYKQVHGTVALTYGKDAKAWVFVRISQNKEKETMYTSTPTSSWREPPAGEFGPRGGIGSWVLRAKTGLGSFPPPTLLRVEKITPPESSPSSTPVEDPNEEEWFDAMTEN